MVDSSAHQLAARFNGSRVVRGRADCRRTHQAGSCLLDLCKGVRHELCNRRGARGRLREAVRSFPEEDRADMVEDDGKIHVTCEYCSTQYEIAPEAVG
ncbi:MAG: hypothetical protein EOP29_25725 [Rhodococcus sp. (in: high G+C Gram-positive bacteria)]|nr:MAG: hypothetical protein EOP29_25725 [Rhodococcus sp. (in: high G+C Gram-positive bacteria)]